MEVMQWCHTLPSWALYMKTWAVSLQSVPACCAAFQASSIHNGHMVLPQCRSLGIHSWKHLSCVCSTRFCWFMVGMARANMCVLVHGLLSQTLLVWHGLL
jgi:hypothetical protein